MSDYNKIWVTTGGRSIGKSYLDDLRKRYLNSLYGVAASNATGIAYSEGTAIVRTDTDKDVPDYVKFDVKVTEDIYKKIKEGENKMMGGLRYYNACYGMSIDPCKMVKKIIRSGKVTVFIWSNGQKDVYRLKDGDEDNFESLFYLAYFRRVNQISGSKAKKLVKKLESKIEQH